MSTINEPNQQKKSNKVSKKQSREETRLAAKSFIESLQATPFPASERIYFKRFRCDNSVFPCAKINLTDTPLGSDPDNLTLNPTEAIYIYDCSGPYADPQVTIDVTKAWLPCAHLG